MIPATANSTLAPAGIGPFWRTRHRGIEDVGIDLSAVPLDEILDFRREHGKAYRAYAHDLGKFVGELAALVGQWSWSR